MTQEEVAAAIPDRPTDWDLTNGQGYILARDRSHASAGRLNLQFYLWKDALGYNIHPTITASLTKTAAIAEVAAGSGIWLIDVSRSYPEAQLDGFDFNIKQAPHEKWLAKNIRMRHLDLLQEIPDEYVGKYDYVHTRLLVLVVENGDPRPIIRNLLRLLKPGGWLQWDELDTVHMEIVKVNDSLETPALEGLRAWSYAGGRHNWTVKLGDAMEEEGMVNCETHLVSDPPALARAFNDQHLLTAEEFAEGLAKLGQKKTAERYFRLVEQAYEESVEGAALKVPRVVCVAQKPL